MSKFKHASLGVAMAAAMLFAGQALATVCPVNHNATQTQGSPTCIAPQGDDAPGTGLQDVFDGMTTNPGDIDVYTGQQDPHAYWSVNTIGTAAPIRLLYEFAGNAPQNSFGIFDRTDSSNRLQLFSGSASAGAYSELMVDGSGHYVVTYFDASHQAVGSASATFADNSHNRFGFYLQTPTDTFFSDDSLNSDGPHMVAYEGDGSTSLTTDGDTAVFGSDDNLLAWEDLPLGSSDMDYNDMIIEISAVHDDVTAVPEPAALGMFGLGLLLIGGFAALRRRERKDQL